MYEERLVAFLDILGFKEAINESSISHTRFNEIKSFLQTYSNSNHAKEVFGNFVNGDGSSCKEGDIEHLKSVYEYSFTQFSDSFVFSVKNENIIASQFFPLLVAEFINNALNLGFLIRGGISIGKMIHDENGPTFGPAFIKAYQLESRQDVFGRVVVSDTAFSFMKTISDFGENFIEDGCDGNKEITISSYINTIYKNNEERRVSEINKAINQLDALKKSVHEENKENCHNKYNYIQEKLLRSIDIKKQ